MAKKVADINSIFFGSFNIKKMTLKWIGMFRVFGGGSPPMKTALRSLPEMQNVAPLVIVVSLGK